LQQQKQDKDNWSSNNKEPEYTPLILDTATAMKVFDKVKSISAQLHGVTSVPLMYVIRVVLIHEDKKDDPPFGEEETKYTSIDMETTARAPILSGKADIFDEEFDNLEAHGPFSPTFLTGTKKIWSILLACFGFSSPWQHFKKFAAQQNGCQAWCTLHGHFFGGDKVSIMVSKILLTLKSLHYSGDHKNFTFDKYCTAHVDQHNCHAALSEWNVAPLEETMKIHYFEDGISDPSFASVMSMIMVDRQKFQEFDAVMWLYVNYMRTQKAEAPTRQAHNVSSLQGCGGGRQGCGGHGRGKRGRSNAHSKGVVPEEEVDKVTTVKAWWYCPEDHAKFTPTKKQRYWQLMQLRKAGKTPGRTSKSSATVAELTTAISAVSAAASAISELTAMTTKHTAAESGETNDNDAIINSKWGWNHNNPAVAGCQEHVPRKLKTSLIRNSALSAFRTTRLAIDPRRYITDLIS
jgi:hypothetical protein